MSYLWVWDETFRLWLAMWHKRNGSRGQVHPSGRESVLDEIKCCVTLFHFLWVCLRSHAFRLQSQIENCVVSYLHFVRFTCDDSRSLTKKWWATKTWELSGRELQESFQNAVTYASRVDRIETHCTLARSEKQNTIFFPVSNGWFMKTETSTNWTQSKAELQKMNRVFERKRRMKKRYSVFVYCGWTINLWK